MSGLSPERREELAKALRGVPIGPFGPNALTVISTGGTTHLNSSERADLADTIAPLVADMLAAEREAGAAEVRARVEAWWADHFGCRLDSCNCRDARDLRSYLNGGESNV